MNNIVDRLGGPAGVALVVICFLGVLTSAKFIVDYARSAGWAWWSNEAGRFLMLSRANLLILLVLVIVNRWFGDWPGRTLVTLVTLTAFIIQATVWPNRILNTMKENRTDGTDTEDDDTDPAPLEGNHPDGARRDHRRRPDRPGDR